MSANCLQGYACGSPSPHLKCARFYPFAIIARLAAMITSKILLFGLLWIITRVLTRYPWLSMILTFVLLKLIDLLVAWIASGPQRKIYNSKRPIKKQAFLYALSILVSRSVGPLLFPDHDRLDWNLSFFFRLSLLAFAATFIAGIQYLPIGCGFMRASSFPLLRNPYQMCLPKLAVLYPDDEHLHDCPRFVSPSLGSIILNVATTTLISGVILGAIYNWTNPLFFILWGLPCFVESLLLTRRSELNLSSPLALPWEQNFNIRIMVRPFLMRLCAFALVFFIIYPGYEGIGIYWVVTFWNNTIDNLIRNLLADQLYDSLAYVRLESGSTNEELKVFLCCILGDIAMEAIDSIRPTEELREQIHCERSLYDRLASAYALSLQQPIHRVEYCIGEDLLKLAALKALGYSRINSFLSIDKTSPQICRVVCAFIGGHGLNLHNCKHRAKNKRLVEWSLAPAFFVAVSWGLDALSSQLSVNTYDMVVFAPIALIAVRQLKEGVDDFLELDRSAEPHLLELISKCESTAINLIRVSREALRSAEKIENFLDSPTIAWVEKFALDAMTFHFN